MSFDFKKYLNAQIEVVDSYLDRNLPPETEYPESIHRAMRYSLFAGGKRLRPVLALAASEAVGGNPQDVLPAAAALEMIHTYSLIHDDLPAMDDDSLRRGKPTSHVVFGEAIAILAGDGLLTEAFRLLAHAPLSKVDHAERRLRAITVLAESAGIAGMVGGQVVDIESEGKPASPETLDYIHRHKTGALIRGAVHLGALLGGGEEEDIEKLTRYGRDIGLAFQIVDDILDVEGDAAALGKTAGKDQRSGKATYPRIHGMDAARRKAKELSYQAVEIAEAYGEAGQPLACLARRIVDRNS
jgi:geranylgeranyl diphosphate synthase type II